MAALRNRAGHYIFALWFLLLLSPIFFLFSSPNLNGRRVDVYHTSKFYKWCGLSANLECRSEMWYTRLGNTGRKNDAKIAISAPSHNYVGHLRN